MVHTPCWGSVQDGEGKGDEREVAARSAAFRAVSKDITQQQPSRTSSNVDRGWLQM